MIAMEEWRTIAHCIGSPLALLFFAMFHEIATYILYFFIV